jgi:hypothetical protein
VKLSVRAHHLICPLCRDRLTAATVCRGCGTGYHRACLRELGASCATLGCQRYLLFDEAPPSLPTFRTVAEHRAHLAREGLLHRRRVEVERRPQCGRCEARIETTEFECPDCDHVYDADCFLVVAGEGCANPECRLYLRPRQPLAQLRARRPSPSPTRPRKRSAPELGLWLRLAAGLLFLLGAGLILTAWAIGSRGLTGLGLYPGRDLAWIVYTGLGCLPASLLTGLIAGLLARAGL